ncbi:L-threonylcarbamoyladenylate synthase [Paenibacillus cellulosilyticus]|uniref:Threonylcarbamoyl-AMP synthase n=1 Tax=Paenibacillus cellulosilyticus TaxID=375489 RepID=A0A2V2YZW2_9BACL|nr:L-threonylcarbamoyladenylate synthase [Paenibacillus cellulosilyticus]PWW08435.1 L-threonylcarbamoyladenylate synthase [Paenibacillus cellulosilyticus]QKS48023.1 threonylcarbamoyl-AMP synthase [Paenibacillus cellulosilyticus]
MTTKTSLWQVLPGADDQAARGAIAEAAQLLSGGGVVAFPTETVYGLGADARQTSAVEQVFAAKGRPSDNPLIVHIADESQLEGLVQPVGDTERALMRRFWPGPLTIVMPAVPGAVSPRVTAGLDTVAVRMPQHDVALRLIAAAGCPVAAPSANRSGRPSPTLADHVREDLDGRIDGLVDGGPTGVGLESTVVMVEAPGVVRILRPGGVTAEQLREVVPTVLLDETLAGLDSGQAPSTAAPEQQLHAEPQAAPRSPGMKYAHYAPRGTMLLVNGDASQACDYIQREVAAAAARGEVTGVLTYEEHKHYFTADEVVVCGSLEQLETAAQGLYAALREFDVRGVESIWAEACPSDGIGLALMNRLAKAAANRIVYV